MGVPGLTMVFEICRGDDVLPNCDDDMFAQTAFTVNDVALAKVPFHMYTIRITEAFISHYRHIHDVYSLQTKECYEQRKCPYLYERAIVLKL